VRIYRQNRDALGNPSCLYDQQTCACFSPDDVNRYYREYLVLVGEERALLLEVGADLPPGVVETIENADSY